MKKNVWLLAGFLSLLCCFACSDDDDNPNQITTYAGENLQLKVNGETTIIGIVTVEKSTESKAFISLLGIIPDDLSLVIEADIVQSGENTKLYGNLEKEFYATEIEGTINGNLLSLNVTYVNTSALTGSWNYSDTYVKIEASGGIILEEGADPVDALTVTYVVKNMLNPYLSSLQKLLLKEEGQATAHYLSLTGEKGTAENFASWYVTTGNIHFIPNLDFLLNLITKSTDTPVLSSLAIKYTLTQEGLILYIDKEFITTLERLLSLLSAIVEEKPAIPENYIQPILAIAQQSSVFELGINFRKPE